MRRLSAVPVLVVLAFFCLSGTASFGQAWNQRSAAPANSTHKQQGFFDYVLGKVNPNGNDYGSFMQAGRDAVVEHTIDDLYFWSNVVTLLLLTGSAAVVFLQWRSADKKEVIAASLIAELWNGRVSDRIEIDRRTEQHNRLVETHNAEVEKTLAFKSQSSEQEKDAAGNLSRNVRKLAETRAPSANKGKSPESSAVDVLSNAGPDRKAADQQQSNLLLQRRVEAMQNNEQNLKQRLNQTTLLLDQERRRNASLKGA
ncbi:MAG: hypothetical protein WA419_16660 [Silvibacterium sp.]